MCWPVRTLKVDQQCFRPRQAQPFEAGQQRRLRQHRHRRAVGQQVGHALVRVGRVDGHVASTGLEHRKQADQCLQTASGDHRHAVVRAYAEADQVMRKGVGTLVQFFIAQAVLAHLRGDGMRARLGLLFDALVQGQCALVLGMVVVEALQQLRTLTGGHDIKLRDRHLRRLLKRIDHAFHGPLQVGA